jgi:hypothetical protein
LQAGRCPRHRPPTDVCLEGGGGFESRGSGNPFHGFNEDLRGVGELRGVQCIYDEDGELVTNQTFAGSFDILPPGGFLDNILHTGADVLPWLLCGGSGPSFSF